MKKGARVVHIPMSGFQQEDVGADRSCFRKETNIHTFVHVDGALVQSRHPHSRIRFEDLVLMLNILEYRMSIEENGVLLT